MALAAFFPQCIFRGSVSVFSEERGKFLRGPPKHNVFRGSPQRVSGGPLSVFPEVPTNCEAVLQVEIHRISGVPATGFRGLGVTVFRVLTPRSSRKSVRQKGCGGLQQ